MFIIYYFRQLLQDLNNIFKVLQVSNSCANIFIYGHMHTNFRRTMKKLFNVKSVREKLLKNSQNEEREKFSMCSVPNNTYLSTTKLIQLNSPATSRTMPSPNIMNKYQNQFARYSPEILCKQSHCCHQL